MQTLQDHLDRLALNHLSNTSIVSEETGTIRDSALTTVISALNSSILITHSRVSLKFKTIYIHEVPGLQSYILDQKYTFRLRDEYESEQDPLDPNYVPYQYLAYIEETEDLFTNDLLTIDSIQKVSGEPFKAVSDNVGSLTIDFKEVSENSLKIRYRSRGTVVPYNAEPSYPVDIPNIALPAIDSYAAYEIFLGIGSNEAMGKVRDYLMKYEQDILLLSEHLVVDTKPSTDNQFMRNGWV